MIKKKDFRVIEYTKEQDRDYTIFVQGNGIKYISYDKNPLYYIKRKIFLILHLCKKHK